MEKTIRQRYCEINDKIQLACSKANRNKEDVKLVVVTKGHSAEDIQQVINAGAERLGENYPEETHKKITDSPILAQANWHMIGHLQSRKIKLVFPYFSYIHSIDSIELALKLNQFLLEKGIHMNSLLEVNISGESSKYGFNASTKAERDSLLGKLESLSELSNLHFTGLMTMPPYALYETQNKECYNLCYEFMRTLSDKLFGKSFCEASMGTSADFTTAIVEGATFVRIGEAIMGERKYPC